MLLIYLDEQALSADEREQCYRESTQLAHELDVAGQYVAASPLEPTATATSVRVRGGKQVVRDGPFAETKEQLGGYFLIDASDLDEAIALAAALERWPESGVPDNPGAWLMASAKHRAIDQLRRGKMLDRKHEQLGHELDAGRDGALPDLDAAIDDPIGDDLLRLMFIACHPVLSTEARVALTLRLLGGLTTDEIARAFLVPEPTVAQRIVRAKRTLREARVPFEVPEKAELTVRLSSVLEV